MMLKNNGYIDYLINFSFSHNHFFQKNQNLSNLKFIFFQSNIEIFKKNCNSMILL
jgi:hypothetical protein